MNRLIQSLILTCFSRILSILHYSVTINFICFSFYKSRHWCIVLGHILPESLRNSFVLLAMEKNTVLKDQTSETLVTAVPPLSHTAVPQTSVGTEHQGALVRCSRHIQEVARPVFVVIAQNFEQFSHNCKINCIIYYQLCKGDIAFVYLQFSLLVMIDFFVCLFFAVLGLTQDHIHTKQMLYLRAIFLAHLRFYFETGFC